MIVTPAATALQLTYSLRRMFVFSALLGAASSAFGLWISYLLSLPPGAAIVLVAALILAVVMFFSPKKDSARL
jgi:manganese/iron transport system permease protein